MGERVSNGVKALDTQGRDDFAFLEGLERRGPIGWLGEGVRVGGLEPVYKIDLFDGLTDL